MALYAVTVPPFGDLLLEASSIRGARKWTRRVWRVGPHQVRRIYKARRICWRCDSRPCCCLEPGR